MKEEAIYLYLSKLFKQNQEKNFAIFIDQKTENESQEFLEITFCKKACESFQFIGNALYIEEEFNIEEETIFNSYLIDLDQITHITTSY